MAEYLLDTNILLRASDAGSDKRSLARNAFTKLIHEGHTCFLTAQVLGEFWSVASRPTDVNGLGWTVERTRSEVRRWQDRFSFIDETPEVFPRWIELISTHEITGRRIFDIRLLAVMLVHGATHLLTFNPSDFPAAHGIQIVEPSDIIRSA